MAVKLTERMKAWIEAMGCHLNVASKNGSPWVTVAREVESTSDDEIVFLLSQDEYSVIKEPLAENPWVAIGPSGVGGIRACYQWKGKGKVEKVGDKVKLTVKVLEVYCTKPGCYAGTRLDTMDFAECKEWEADLWKDMPK